MLIKNLFNSAKKYNILVWGDDFVADALFKWLSASIHCSCVFNSRYIYSNVVLSEEFYKERKLSEDSINKIVQFAKKSNINLFICDWSDNTQGIIECFERNGIKTIGVNKRFSKIETKKHIGKKFMELNGIKTAPYILAKTKEDIYEGLSKFGFPLVVKANGPARGLGVFICKNNQDIENAYLKLTSDILFPKQEEFIVEQYIDGKEIVLVSLWDEKNLLPLPILKDYKLRFEGNTGNNTGSMGQFFPFEINNEEAVLLDNYIKKLQKALRRIKANYRGAIYSALMFKDKEIYCLEYNMRIGLTEGPLFTIHSENEPKEILDALLNKKLDRLKLKWKNGKAACVNIVNKQYPEIIREDITADVSAIKEIEADDISIFSNANLKIEGEKYKSKGTLFFCLAKSSLNPIEEIYNKLSSIDFDKSFQNCDYRKDIGQ